MHKINVEDLLLSLMKAEAKYTVNDLYHLLPDTILARVFVDKAIFALIDKDKIKFHKQEFLIRAS